MNCAVCGARDAAYTCSAEAWPPDVAGARYCWVCCNSGDIEEISAAIRRRRNSNAPQPVDTCPEWQQWRDCTGVTMSEEWDPDDV